MRERVKREAGHPDLDTPFLNPTSLGDSTLAPSALGLLTSFSIIRSLRDTFKNFTPPAISVQWPLLETSNFVY